MNKSNKITQKEINTLQSMIGKTFEKFKCDPFIFSSNVYGLVGIYIDRNVYKLSAFLEPIQRFFSLDDVSRLRVVKCNDLDIQSKMDGGKFIDTPVGAIIESISIIVDHQKVIYKSKEKSFDFIAGLIFHFDDSHEIAFEVSEWFSEMIAVNKGYNLFNKFVSTNSFLEEWDGLGDYSASINRECIVLK